MNSNALGFLGLIRRAGKLTIGCDPIVDSMKKGTAKLVLMASDISPNTKKTILRNSKEYGVHTIIVKCSKEELSFAVGKLAAVVSVDDEGFAEGIKKKLTDDTVMTSI
ncbi:MAG: ribosomal L7Ae/L30e/S12e/Gadd45 family protein [Clostridia bacterium]|nr:ribosomal L7Ae/L30e/S12e/Gadd45 family protein [Clostridia bacterium]